MIENHRTGSGKSMGGLPEITSAWEQQANPVFRLRYVLTGVYVLLLLGAALGGSQLNLAKTGLPFESKTPPAELNRDSLVTRFRADRKLMFVYGSGNPATAAQYKSIINQGVLGWDHLETAVRSDAEVTEAELAAWTVFLVGTPGDNRLLRAWLPQLPFSFREGGLSFNDKQFDRDPLLVLSFIPNPDHPQLPISLVTAPQGDRVIDYLQGMNWQWFSLGGWGYQVYNAGTRAIMGNFNDQPGHEWEIGGQLHWDYSEPPQVHGAFQFAQMYVHDPDIPEAVLDSAGEALDTALIRALRFTEQDPNHFPQLIWNIFGSTEDKGLRTGNTHPVHHTKKQFYQALAPEFNGFASELAVVFALRNRWGKAPTTAALEKGLAIWLTDGWQGRGWQYWAALLHHSGNALPVAELLDDDLFLVESPLVTGCMSAALVDYLLETRGKSALLRDYQNWRASPATTKKLQKGLDAHLDALVAQIAPQFPPRATAAALPAFQKGFNLAHEGYQIYNGYASASATQSLKYTAEQLHSNVTAIVPYTGMGNPNRPSYLPIANGAGTENDESIIHCLYSARQAGLASLLKPQVWLQEGWPGSVEMKNSADWDAFIRYYYRWMRHYALLGEMHGADALCIGVEFQEATLQRPEDWKTLIRKLKGIFHGPVTYAANWGREFEGLQIAEELDFIGLNCYYPLSDQEKVSDQELDRGFARVMNKIEAVARKWNKPIVFTEIGFPSIAAPWREPHAEPRDRPPSATDQARCYAAMIRALQDRDWCGGVYLWKWPAYPNADGSWERVRGFTPLGKPAEAMVADWFRDI
ncbi:MAG: hypothetical protein AAGN35_05575 [Bacteroidota bacterium]